MTPTRLVLALAAASLVLVVVTPADAYTDYQNCNNKKFPGGWLNYPTGHCAITCASQMGVGVQVTYDEPSVDDTVYGSIHCADAHTSCSAIGTCQSATPVMTTYTDVGGGCDGSTNDGSGGDLLGNNLYLTCYTWWPSSSPASTTMSSAQVVSYVTMQSGGPGTERGESCGLTPAGTYHCIDIRPTCRYEGGAACSAGQREVDDALARGAPEHERASAPVQPPA